MVLVSHLYKFIYIKNRKVAGSSVESFFGQFCQDPEDPYEFNDQCNEKVSEYGIIGKRLNGHGQAWISHKHASDIKRDLGPEIFNEYTKFSVIRNPYDKAVSLHCYFRPHQPFKPTNCYNLDIHSIDGEDVCDFHIRYENLYEDILSLCQKL